MDILDILYKTAVFILFAMCVLMFLFVILMEYKWKLMDKIDKEKRKELVQPLVFTEKEFNPGLWIKQTADTSGK